MLGSDIDASVTAGQDVRTFWRVLYSVAYNDYTTKGKVVEGAASALFRASPSSFLIHIRPRAEIRAMASTYLHTGAFIRRECLQYICPDQPSEFGEIDLLGDRGEIVLVECEIDIGRQGDRRRERDGCGEDPIGDV